MSITVDEMAVAIQNLHLMKTSTPWYKPLAKYRLAVMIETLLGILEWVAKTGDQRNCGCADHTDHFAN